MCSNIYKMRSEMVPMLELQHELRKVLQNKAIGEIFDALTKDRM